MQGGQSLFLITYTSGLKHSVSNFEKEIHTAVILTLLSVFNEYMSMKCAEKDIFATSKQVLEWTCVP